MTDQPTTKTDQARFQESRTQSGGTSSSGGQSTSPPASPTIGDPARRGFGDKTDDESKRTDPSRANYKSTQGDVPGSGDQDDDDAGEGHKGPRVDSTTVSSDRRSPGDRSSPSSEQNRPNRPTPQTQKAPPTNVPGNSGGDCSSSKKTPEAHSDHNQSSGSAAV